MEVNNNNMSKSRSRTSKIKANIQKDRTTKAEIKYLKVVNYKIISMKLLDNKVSVCAVLNNLTIGKKYLYKIIMGKYKMTQLQLFN
jgi:hypothetical protein